jgi:Zn-dependent M28 family amino/carboxypeptidase
VRRGRRFCRPGARAASGLAATALAGFIAAWGTAPRAAAVPSPPAAQAPAAASAARTSTSAGTRRVDRAELLADMTTLAADAMQGRAPATPGSARARAFLVSRFRAAGIRPFPGGYTQAFPLPPAPGRSAGAQGTNVLGYIPGTRTPDRYIVVSAHYDHLGVKNGVVFNGANDNASGAAALVAIGRYYAAHPPAHSLLIAAFDAEEEGLVGSRAFVKDPPVPRSAIVVDLNPDMIGRDPSRTLYVSGTSQQPALAPLVADVAADAPVRLVMGHDDPRAFENWSDESDQYAFIEAGIPGLYIGVEDYAHHHAPTDDASTMMPDFYAGAVETVMRIIDRFDDSGR